MLLFWPEFFGLGLAYLTAVGEGIKFDDLLI